MVLVNPSFLRFAFPWIVWKGPTGRNEVVLTFDDGPHPLYTPKTSDILLRHGTRGLFFLNGQGVVAHPGIVDKLRQDGHGLGIHGYTHRRMDFRRRDWILREIRTTMQAVEKSACRKPVYFRPPYGRFDFRFKPLLAGLNLVLVLWSLMTCDFRGESPNTLIRRIHRRIHPGAILVFHDGHENAPAMLAALPGILALLADMGYRVKTLDEWTGRTR
jgi:peptidoglycan/xylan/chitin deacetylase (PgdA/CDA1 family)